MLKTLFKNSINFNYLNLFHNEKIDDKIKSLTINKEPSIIYKY